MELTGEVLVKGPAITAPLVYTDTPLSFWGGYDAHQGRVVDRHHPLYGTLCAGTVLALPGGRGSSTASGVLLESIRAETAPGAILVSRLDPILVLGLVVAEETYGRTRTLVRLEPDDFQKLQGFSAATVTPEGRITLS
jgi:predicted aconitase with swiveling domain